MPVDLAEWEPVAEEAKPKEADLSEWEAVPAAAPKPQFKDLSAAQPLSLRPNVGRIRPPEQMTTYGGPPKAVASLPETLAEPVEAWMNPRVTTPKLTVNKDDNPAVAVGKEAVNIASSIPEFLSSNMGLASVVSGMVAPTATSAAFTVDMLKNVGEGIATAHKNWGSMTPAQKWAAITDIGGNALMAMLTGKHAATGVLNEVVPARHVAKMLSESEFKPRPTGESLYELAQRSAQAKAAPTVAETTPEGQPAPATETSVPTAAAETPATPTEKANPHDFVPAIQDVSGEVLQGEKGKSHEHILQTQKPEWDDWQVANLAHVREGEMPGRGFWWKAGNGGKGEFVTRARASELLGQKEPLHSAQLAKLQEEPPQAAVDKTKPFLLSAAVQDPKTGNWFQGANHPEVEQHLKMPETSREQRNVPGYGFTVQMPDGKLRVVGRQEATEIAKASGQAVEPFEAGTKIHSNQVVSALDPAKLMGDDKQPVRPVAAAAPVPTPPAEAPKGARKYSGLAYREPANEFKRLVMEYGEQLGWIKNPDVIAPEVEQIKSGINKATMGSIRAHNAEVSLAIKRAMEDIGITEPKNTPRAKAQALEKLKAHLDKYKNLVSIPMNQLGKGSTFTYLGEKKTVGETDADTGTVQIRDGVKLDAPMEGSVKADPGSIKAVATSSEFVPTEPPLAGQLGGGAAELGEVGTGANEDIMGVRQVTREKQSAVGQPVVAQPGEGTNLQRSLEDGRARLARDPAAADRAREQFDSTGKLSSEDFNVARAKYEQVMAEGRKIASKFGTMSPEYHAARMDAFTWSDLTKRMQTEWHRMGVGQQGETDIDMGNVLEIEKDYHDKTGGEFTPDQRKKATKVAKENKDAQDATAQAQQRLNEHLRARGTGGMSAAEKRAFDAANKTVRDAATRMSQAETKLRVAQTVREKQTADIQVKAAKRAFDAATKRAKQMAEDLAKRERKLQGDPLLRVWTKAKEYLDAGMDNFDDIRKKLATDLGMSIEQVTRTMAQDNRAKYLADNLWRKQQAQRNLKSEAKRWVQSLSTPGYQRVINSVPKIMFGLKVGFHGTVALGTHAPTVAFQPRFWNAYVRDFGKMYKMVGSKSYYEMQVQDLMRRDNYITARRAGLVNDPFVFEDYNSPDTAKYFGKLTGMGNRGYTVLKILRQDMFDQQWNQLPKSAQIPEMAQALADGINHATGVVKGRAPTAANLALFAPRLEASRVAWLVVDPKKAAGTLLNWKNATQGEKFFAMNQIKEKAWVVGTLSSLLALNAGVLSAIGSKQKINLSDPFKSDYLKFKVAGMTVSYGNPMITMARLPLRLFVGIVNEGKFSKLVYEDENVATILFEYVRSQMSPFAGTATDLAIGRDFMRKPLPRAGFGLLPGKTNLPKRLKAEGIKPYTWTEYGLQQAAMIPVQEGLKEVWGKDLMMDANARENSLKALATIIVMGGTGARIGQDYSLTQPTQTKKNPFAAKTAKVNPFRAPTKE